MGFRYAGIHSRERGIILLKVPISLLPATRDKIIVLPGRRGVLRYRPDVHERIWSLDCVVEGSSYRDLWVRVRAIETWLSPTGIRELVFDAHPTHRWMAILTGEINVVVRGGRHGFFTLTFACPDPNPVVVL
ncbi:MAG: hypothetical protein DDT33_01711 [Firmicutes bacterium]|nr:hypothetical protein [Bacillota bacterium]